MAETSTVPRGLLDRFVRDERGATAIEYGMIAVFVSIAIAATVFGAGDSLLKNFYQRVLDELNGASAGT